MAQHNGVLPLCFSMNVLPRGKSGFKLVTMKLGDLAWPEHRYWLCQAVRPILKTPWDIS